LLDSLLQEIYILVKIYRISKEIVLG